MYRLSMISALIAAASAIPTLPSHLTPRFGYDYSICNASAVTLSGIEPAVPDSTAGELMTAYQPYLYVVDGCVPFPAVNQSGCTSEGLAPTGSPDGDCSSNLGQVYSRSAYYNGSYAIMYSWFFPKDEPVEAEVTNADGGDEIGHRYDWEGCVVWLSSESTDATLLGAAASYHGDYVTETDPATDGDHVLIKYYSAYDVLDHSCGFTTTVGGMQPLIAWESMSAEQQLGIAGKDWVAANPPFIDANFENNLALAAL